MFKHKPLLLLSLFIIISSKPVFGIFGFFEESDTSNNSNQLEETSDRINRETEEVSKFSFQEAFDAKQAAIDADQAIIRSSDKAKLSAEKASMALESADNLAKKLDQEFKIKSKKVEQLKSLSEQVNINSKNILSDLNKLSKSLDIKKSEDSNSYFEIDNANDSVTSAIKFSNLAVKQMQDAYNVAKQELDLAKEELLQAKVELAQKKLESSYAQEIYKTAMKRAEDAKLQAVKRNDKYDKLNSASDVVSIDIKDSTMDLTDDKQQRDLSLPVAEPQIPEVDLTEPMVAPNKTEANINQPMQPTKDVMTNTRVNKPMDSMPSILPEDKPSVNLNEPAGQPIQPAKDVMANTPVNKPIDPAPSVLPQDMPSVKPEQPVVAPEMPSVNLDQPVGQPIQPAKDVITKMPVDKPIDSMPSVLPPDMQ